jgi:hypothetical protein
VGQPLGVRRAHQAGARLHHLARVRGTSHARNAGRAEGPLERNRRRRAVGRHEALGQRHDPRLLVHAESLDLAEGLAEPLRRHGEEDQVRARELVVAVAEGAHLQRLRQPHSGQVALVLSRAREDVGLLCRAAEQRGAQARALQQDRHGGAERACADHGGPAGMPLRGADARDAIRRSG